MGAREVTVTSALEVTVISQQQPSATALHTPRVLYITYDGLLEPLGQSQVQPYVRELAAQGARITLISFEKPADRRQVDLYQSAHASLARSGIQWIPLTYHKRPSLLATTYDLVIGIIVGWRVVTRASIELVHARSYIPATMAWCLKRLCKVRMIFDMRGFWADGRVDSGQWPSTSRLYRLAKRLEHQLLADADEIVTLSDAAREVVEQWPGLSTPRVTVIPTCVDLDRFALVPRRFPPVSAPVFLYTGSLGTWYLMDEMAQLFERALHRFPEARFIILTRDIEEAKQPLRRSPAARAVTIHTVSPEQIPSWLGQAHVGLSLIKSGTSWQGVCPTKLGEYFATGLPVIATDQVGDIRAIIESNNVGVVLRSCTSAAYDAALDQLESLWADPTLPARCRHVAESIFALSIGTSRYWSLYCRDRICQSSGSRATDEGRRGIRRR